MRAAECGEGASCEPGDNGSVCVAAGGIGAGRCRESLDCADGNVCVDSYCKLGRGEPCTTNQECASSKCYGSLDYYCL